MAISLGGGASGIDTNSLVQSLVAASSGRLNQLNSAKTGYTNAASSVGAVGSALSELRTATQNLSSTVGFASIKATSSSTAIVPTADSTATAGSYNVVINDLARDQRNYSIAAPASNTTDLNMAGSFTLRVGAGAPATINLVSGDTLDGVASKINQAGLRVQASVVNTGSGYKLQVRGLDTGAANSLTFDEAGMAGSPGGNLGLSTPGSVAQTALDASITIDNNITVTRATNDFTNAIPGVTLALKEKIATPVRIDVAPDTATFTSKVQAVISAYNKVVSASHVASGYGANADAFKTTNKYLRGDSAIRQVLNTLSSWTKGDYTSAGAGNLKTLGDVGIKLTSTDGKVDGTLTLDVTKLQSVYAANPKDVEKLFTRPFGATTGGAMANLSDSVNVLNKFGEGVIPLRKAMFDDRVKKIDKQMSDENARLDRMEERLKKQFAEMEKIYSSNQAQLSAARNIATG